MPTAEVLREPQEPETKAPPRDPTSEALLEGLAASSRELERTGQLQEETTARQLERSKEIERLAQERAEARRKALPEVEAADRKAEAAIRQVPTPPELPPAPDTRRRAFLEGPTPAKDAIQQFLGAVTALAAPLGGLIAGDGLTAMNAINGAMQGWMKGDEDRLQREWATWQAATDRLLNNYALQNKHYLDILGSTKMTLEMKYRALERAGLEYEDKLMILAAGEKSDEHIQTALNQRENRLLNFQKTVLDLEVRRDTAMMLDETRRDIAAMQQGKEGAPSAYKTFYQAEKAKGKTDAEIDADWMNRETRLAAIKAESATEAKLGKLNVGALADAMANGQMSREDISNAFGIPVRGLVESEVLKRYPKFNLVLNEANAKWAVNPMNQRAMGMIQAVLPRLDGMLVQLTRMPNVDIPALNAVMRQFYTQTGRDEFTNYESNRNAIVQEVNTALSGSSTGSDFRVHIELENLKATRSPRQLVGSIDNLRAALISRLEAGVLPAYPMEVVRGEKTRDDLVKEIRKQYGRRPIVSLPAGQENAILNSEKFKNAPEGDPIIVGGKQIGVKHGGLIVEP